MNDIDFLPEHIRIQRMRQSRLIREGYLLLVCIGVLAVLVYFQRGWISTARAELGLLSEREDNVRRQLAIRHLLEQQQAEFLVKQRIDETLGTRINTLALLAELERIVPEQIVMTNLEFDTMVVHVPVEPVGRMNRTARPASGAGQEQEKALKRIRLTLTGLARTDVDVANFIGQLAASPILEDVNMGYAKTVLFRGEGTREFQASCYVVK